MYFDILQNILRSKCFSQISDHLTIYIFLNSVKMKDLFILLDMWPNRYIKNFPLWGVLLPASKFLQVHAIKYRQEGDCFNHRNLFWNFAKNGEAFQQVSWDFFDTEPFVMDRLISTIVGKYPKEEYEVIRKFIRTRTFIRLKYINIVNKSSIKRKIASNVQKTVYFIS
uniref:Uncharacterized protein n=1 Tax=Lepeophtheirus salmonis TaxID=72036 RepID=A0A0K2UTP0_LEPSM